MSSQNLDPLILEKIARKLESIKSEPELGDLEMLLDSPDFKLLLEKQEIQKADVEKLAFLHSKDSLKDIRVLLLGSSIEDDEQLKGALAALNDLGRAKLKAPQAGIATTAVSASTGVSASAITSPSGPAAPDQPSTQPATPPSSDADQLAAYNKAVSDVQALMQEFTTTRARDFNAVLTEALKIFISLSKQSISNDLMKMYISIHIDTLKGVFGENYRASGGATIGAISAADAFVETEKERMRVAADHLKNLGPRGQEKTQTQPLEATPTSTRASQALDQPAQSQHDSHEVPKAVAASRASQALRENREVLQTPIDGSVIADRMQRVSTSADDQSRSLRPVDTSRRETVFSNGHRTSPSQTAISTVDQHSFKKLKEAIHGELEKKHGEAVKSTSLTDLTTFMIQKAPPINTINIQVRHTSNSTQTILPKGKDQLEEIFPQIVEAHLKQGLRTLVPDAQNETQLQYMVKHLLERGIEVNNVGERAKKIIEDGGSNVQKYLTEMRNTVNQSGTLTATSSDPDPSLPPSPRNKIS